MVRAVVLAFVSGILVVGSPCTLPILPGFVASLAATGAGEGSGG